MKHLLFCLLMMMFVLEAKAQTFSIMGSYYSNSCWTGVKLPVESTHRTCHDGYGVRLKIAEPATFSVDRLWVRDKCLFVLDKTNVYRKFKPTIDRFVSVSASNRAKNQTKPYTKPPVTYTGAGLLRCKINNKITYIEIKHFESMKPY